MNKLNKIFIHKYKLPGKAIEYNSKTQKVVVEYEKRQGKHTHLVKEEFNRSEISPFRQKQNNKTNKQPLNIPIKYLDPEMPELEQTKKGDLIDLRSRIRVELKAGDFMIIPLGVAMDIPEGWKADVVPRSSAFKKWGIIQTNGVGKIDNSFSGNEDEWGMPVYATRDTVIEKYDRICQFEITRKMPKVRFPKTDDLGNPSRGGFGSTGSK